MNDLRKLPETVILTSISLGYTTLKDADMRS